MMTPGENNWSRSRIRSLGKRLTSAPEPAVDDISLLHSLLLTYDQAMGVAVSRIEDSLGVRVTARLKNTITILEKLRRSGGGSLPNVQDLAGIRIVEDLDWGSQDRMAESVMSLFLDARREPTLIDRRINPSHGYRAVHVVAFIDDRPVEIQIRTLLQHRWANNIEKLADVVGRGIRYGEGPDDWSEEVGSFIVGALKNKQDEPSDVVKTAISAIEDTPGIVQQAVTVAVDSLSEAIAGYELARTIHNADSETISSLPAELLQKIPSVEEVDQLRLQVESVLDQYRDIVQNLLQRKKNLEVIHKVGRDTILRTIEKELRRIRASDTPDSGRADIEADTIVNAVLEVLQRRRASDTPDSDRTVEP